MEQKDREYLIMSAASAIHEDWCEGELKAFYDRFLAERANGATFADALRGACLKNGKPRNECVPDMDWIYGHTTMIDEDFKTVVVEKPIEVVKKDKKEDFEKISLFDFIDDDD